VPAQHRHGQQGETGLARERRQRPQQPDPVGPPEALHQGRPAGHHHCRQHQARGRVPALQHRTGNGQRDRHARHRDAQHGRFGVPGAQYQRHVEAQHAGRHHPAQPQPFGAARPDQPAAGRPREDGQQHAGHGVAGGLDGEHRRVGESA
jgi:hypothetical protein